MTPNEKRKAVICEDVWGWWRVNYYSPPHKRLNDRWFLTFEGAKRWCKQNKYTVKYPVKRTKQ